MPVQQTQAPQAAVSSAAPVQSLAPAQSAPTKRSSLTVALSAPISGLEFASARLFLGDGRHGGGHHGPHRPGGPYYPYPYPPIPVPMPVPVPVPYPYPYPAERRCYPWEIGGPGSRVDIFGQWWCRAW